MFRLASALVIGSSCYASCWNPNFDVKIMDHPVKDLLMSRIRNRNTDKEEFVHHSNRLLHLLLEYTLGHEPKKVTQGKTPTNGTYDNYELIHDNNYVVVVILRAGASMLPETQCIMPHIKTGFILIQRNENSAEKNPIFYYSKLPPNISEKRVILVDPMLATGGSAVSAITELKKAGVQEESIVFVNLIACETGINNLFTRFPKISMVTAQVDPILNEDCYLVPGLGDFGDRYFGTESSQ